MDASFKKGPDDVLKSVGSVGAKIRWIRTQCYQLMLPNGKTIVTDPCITSPLPGIPYLQHLKTDDFAIDDFGSADYIILTHTHMDHDLDVGHLYEKYHSRVLCPAGVAPEVVKFFRITGSDVVPLESEREYMFPDFTLNTYYATHNRGGSGMPYDGQDATLMEFGVEGHATLHDLGTLFNLNYLISLPDNLRIGFMAGIEYEQLCERWKTKAPNVLIAQPKKNKTDRGLMMWEDLAACAQMSHAQIVLPVHHDSMQVKGKEACCEWVKKANDYLIEHGSISRVAYPEKYKWYDISVSISLDNEE